MRISNITLELNSTDLQTLINKFLPENKVYISSIILDNTIIAKGKLPIKSLSVPFSCEFTIISYLDNYININISSFSAMNVSIPSKIKDLALKTFISIISIDGISIKDKLLTIKIDVLLQEFMISSIQIEHLLASDDKLYIRLSNITSLLPIVDFFNKE